MYWLNIIIILKFIMRDGNSLNQSDKDSWEDALLVGESESTSSNEVSKNDTRKSDLGVPPPPSQKEKTVPKESNSSPNAKNILLVDDDPLIIRMYQKKLSADGYDISIAFNGEEAMTEIMKIKPSLIFLDVMMPEMNGVEVLKKLKSDPNTENIPVIILTNLGDKPEDVDKAKELGALDYLVKSELKLKELPRRAKEIVGEPTYSHRK